MIADAGQGGAERDHRIGRPAQAGLGASDAARWRWYRAWSLLPGWMQTIPSSWCRSALSGCSRSERRSSSAARSERPAPTMRAADAIVSVVVAMGECREGEETER